MCLLCTLYRRDVGSFSLWPHTNLPFHLTVFLPTSHHPVGFFFLQFYSFSTILPFAIDIKSKCGDFRFIFFAPIISLMVMWSYGVRFFTCNHTIFRLAIKKSHHRHGGSSIAFYFWFLCFLLLLFFYFFRGEVVFYGRFFQFRPKHRECIK